MSHLRETPYPVAFPADQKGRPIGMMAGFILAATLGLVVLSGGSLPFIAIGFAGLALTALTLGNPLLGLAGLIVMIFANVSDNFITYLGLPSTAKLVAPGLAGLVLYRWLFAGERPFFHMGALALAGGFVLVKLLSVPFAANWRLSMEIVSDFLKVLIVAFLALAFIGRKRGFETLTWTAVATAAVLCALGVFKFAVGDYADPFLGFSQIGGGNVRFSGPIGDPNFFAAMLVAVIPLALHAALNAPKLAWRLFGLLALALLLSGLVLTKSRGGLIAGPLGLLVLTPFLERRQIFALVGMGAATILVTGSLLSEELLARFGSILQVAQSGEAVDAAVEGRLASWSVARQLFYDNPLIGVGVGNFNAYYQDYALGLGLIFRGEGRSAHSLYLEILAETGLVGFFAFACVAGASIFGTFQASVIARRAGRPRLSAHYAAFGAGIVAYLVAMTFLHDGFPRLLWIILVAGIALPAIAREAVAAPGSDATRS